MTELKQFNEEFNMQMKIYSEAINLNRKLLREYEKYNVLQNIHIKDLGEEIRLLRRINKKIKGGVKNG